MPTKRTKPTEFSWSETTGASWDSARSGLTYFVLTNSLNLVDMLSSGIIKPAANYQKYYPDIGSECPHSVPLLVAPPAADLLEHAVPDTGIAKPVLLEIAADGLSGPSWVISSEYKVRKAKISQKENVSAQLINGILPSSLITVVHFRSAADLGEFIARKYANMDPDNSGISFRCSSELFSRTDPNTGLLLDAIRATGKKVPFGNMQIIPTVDAIAGALFLLGKYASMESGFPLSRYADLFNHYLEVGDTNIHEEKESNDPFAWMTDITGFLPFPLNRVFSSFSVENMLCRSAIRQSILLNPGDFSPDTHLEDIINRFEADLKELSIPDHEAIVENHRNATRLLLDTRMGLASMDDFFSAYPMNEYPTFAALFLLLVENRPQDLINILDQYPGFPVATKALSICLAGALHGRTRLELDIRPGKRLSYVLDMASISLINKTLESVRLPAFVTEATVTTQSDDRFKVETLSISGETLIERKHGTAVKADSTGGEQIN